MTQKQYKENILNLENEVKELRKEVEFARDKTYNYEKLLEDYHRTSENLRIEEECNRQNELTIERLQKTIEQYERILDKFTINYN